MKSRLLKVILPIFGVFAIVFVWPHRLVLLFQAMTPRVVWKVKTAQPAVALTFDDGPDPVYTPQVLDLLKRSGVSATFFLIGERAARYPDIVARICAEGHEIANHSGSTARTLFLRQPQFATDFESAQRVIGSFRCAQRMFRPAGIWIRPSQVAALRDQGYDVVLGSAYGHDPQRPPSRYISWVIGRALSAGVIIVLHDSGGDRSHTVQALPQIVSDVHSRGLQFVTLSRLLAQGVPTEQRDVPAQEAAERR